MNIRSKLLIIISLSLLAFNSYSQEDNLLTIKRSRLEFLVSSHIENGVLKKRIILKDSALLALEASIKVKEDIISSKNSEIISYELIVKNKQAEIANRERMDKELQTINRKLRKQNTILKIAVIPLSITTFILLMQ